MIPGIGNIIAPGGINVKDGSVQLASIQDEYLYISYDFGQTWNVCLSVAAGWKNVSINGSANLMLATSGDGLYRSMNYGKAWDLLPNTNYNADVACSNDGSYVFRVDRSDGTVYVSTDKGDSWNSTSISSIITDPYAIGCSADGKYVLVLSFKGKPALSTDYGQSFSNPFYANTDFQTASLSGDGQYQIAGGVSMFQKSSNYGDSWTYVGSITLYCSDINLSGQYQCRAGDFRIFVSSDYGQTWSDTTPSIQHYFDISMNGSGQYVSAVDYDGNLYVSSDYGQTWSVAMGTAKWCSVAINKLQQ